MDPAKIVELIDEWNPRAPELQESPDATMYVDRTQHDFVQRLVFHLDRLDLDTLSVEGDERLALEEAIEVCRSTLQVWNSDSKSEKGIAGDGNRARNNSVIVIRRILSEAQLVNRSSGGPPFDRVFISHHERNLAELLDAEIRARLSETTTFIASRPGDIPDEEWFDTVRRELQEADAYICIVTPTSKERPWVIWEHGAAWMSGKLLVTARAGIANSELPQLFTYRQTRSLEDPEQAALVFKALGDTGEEVDAFCEKISAEIAAVAGSSPVPGKPRPIYAHFTSGQNGWKKLSRRLELDLVGSGPVEVNAVEAWMTHVDDPTTPHAGIISDPLPKVLGGDIKKLPFDVRFPVDKLPEDLLTGTADNRVTFFAEVRYVDSEGIPGTAPAEQLA